MIVLKPVKQLTGMERAADAARSMFNGLQMCSFIANGYRIIYHGNDSEELYIEFDTIS